MDIKKHHEESTDKIKFYINTLKQYAKENGILIRSTSDLSPLEQHLLIQLYNKECKIKYLDELIDKRYV